MLTSKNFNFLKIILWKIFGFIVKVFALHGTHATKVCTKTEAHLVC